LKLSDVSEPIHRSPGWVFVHFEDHSQIDFLRKELHIQIRSGSFIDPNWATVFLTASQFSAVKSLRV
jgi:hypothetical protein